MFSIFEQTCWSLSYASKLWREVCRSPSTTISALQLLQTTQTRYKSDKAWPQGHKEYRSHFRVHTAICPAGFVTIFDI